MEKQAYFIHPIIVELQKEKNPEKRKKLKEKLAVNISSREALKAVLGEEAEDFGSFYPDMMPKHLSTDDTIDSFIDKFGSKGPESIDTLLTQSGPSDYFAAMGSGEIIEEPAEEEPEEEKEEETPVQGDLSVGFAKILIKNGNYAKALEIIKEINLKNPEKSIYFADQIRFIKKLMLNEAKKKSKISE